jgi:hypothetical protein
MGRLYPEPPEADTTLQQLAKQLVEPRPYDFDPDLIALRHGDGLPRLGRTGLTACPFCTAAPRTSSICGSGRPRTAHQERTRDEAPVFAGRARIVGAGD